MAKGKDKPKAITSLGKKDKTPGYVRRAEEAAKAAKSAGQRA